MKKLKYIAITIVITIISIVQQANTTPNEQVLYRQKVMGTVGVLMHVLDCIDREACTLDNKDLSNIAKSIVLMSELSEPAFKERPEDNQITIKHTAKPEIWSNWERFVSNLQNMTQSSAQIASLASSGHRDAALNTIGKLGETCKNCHNSFRTK